MIVREICTFRAREKDEEKTSELFVELIFSQFCQKLLETSLWKIISVLKLLTENYIHKNLDQAQRSFIGLFQTNLFIVVTPNKGQSIFCEIGSNNGIQGEI